jgi:hypothetical protein
VEDNTGSNLYNNKDFMEALYSFIVLRWYNDGEKNWLKVVYGR